MAAYEITKYTENGDKRSEAARYIEDEPFIYHERASEGSPCRRARGGRAVRAVQTNEVQSTAVPDPFGRTSRCHKQEVTGGMAACREQVVAPRQRNEVVYTARQPVANYDSAGSVRNACREGLYARV